MMLLPRLFTTWLMLASLPLWAAPPTQNSVTNSDQPGWQFEFGSASLFRQAPWQNGSGDALSVPTIAARRGNWRFGLDYGLVSYFLQWQSTSLNIGLGVRDETINSTVWGDSDDPKLREFKDGGAELTANLGLQWGLLSLTADQDISGQSDGLTVTSHLALPLFKGAGEYAPRAQWLVGARWMDENYSNHLLGVSARQANQDFAEFHAQQSVNPQLGIQFMWPIDPQWLIRLRWHREWLDNKLRKSPLAERNSSQFAALTFTYRFSE